MLQIIIAIFTLTLISGIIFIMHYNNRKDKIDAINKEVHLINKLMNDNVDTERGKSKEHDKQVKH
jgi:hypothetical protein